MKMRVMLMVAMLALSGVAYATSENGGGEPKNTNCNGVGNVNSPCGGSGGGGGDNGGGGGGGGAGGNGGNGGNATAGAIAVAGAAALASADVDVRNTNTNTNLNAQQQGQVQGQQQAAIATGNNLTVAEGAVTNTVTSGNATANVGDVTSTGGNAVAEGGAGGQAVSAAVVESGAATAVVESGAVQYTYTERLQAPAIGQGSFAISGCGVAGNAGGSGPGWAGFLGFGFTPPQCYDFMLAQAYQAIGEKKAVCDILKASKAGQRQLKRGITLPECAPEVVAVPVVVAPPAPEPKTVYVEVPPAKISE